MKKLVFLLLFILPIMAIADDIPHQVFIYFENAEGNYPASSDLSFSATLYEDDGVTEVGTITGGNAPTSRYISTYGALLIECSNFGDWNIDYELEVTITYNVMDPDEVISLDGTTFERIILNNSSFQKYDDFDGDSTNSNYSPWIFGLTSNNQDDVQGLDADTDTYTDTFLEFNYYTPGTRADDDVRVDIDLTSTTASDITVKQYDNARTSIPQSSKCIGMTVEIEDDQLDYSGNVTTYTFAWNYDFSGITDPSQDSDLVALYTVDSGDLWQEIGHSSSADIYISSYNYDTTEGDFGLGLRQYGLAITIKGDIYTRAHEADLMFCFGKGDGSDLLELSTPSNTSIDVDNSSNVDYDIYLNWDTVAGATAYNVKSYDALNTEWVDAGGVYNSILSSYIIEGLNETEKHRVFRVKAESNKSGYDTESDESVYFGFSEYLPQEYFRTNNNFIAVPFVNSFSTNPETFATNHGNIDQVSQWDATNQCWKSAYYDLYFEEWINHDNLVLDFDYPVVINTDLVQWNWFAEGNKREITYSGFKEGDNYIIVPVGYTTTHNYLSELKDDISETEVTEVYRFVNTSKKWHSPETNETFYWGQILKLVMDSDIVTSWPSGRRGGNTGNESSETKLGGIEQ